MCHIPWPADRGQKPRYTLLPREPAPEPERQVTENTNDVGMSSVGVGNVTMNNAATTNLTMGDAAAAAAEYVVTEHTGKHAASEYAGTENILAGNIVADTDNGTVEDATIESAGENKTPMTDPTENAVTEHATAKDAANEYDGIKKILAGSVVEDNSVGDNGSVEAATMHSTDKAETPMMNPATKSPVTTDVTPTRSSMRLLARNLSSPSGSNNSPSPSERSYSMRARVKKNYNVEQVFGQAFKKRKSTPPETPKTPKVQKTLGSWNTPQATKSAKKPSPSVKSKGKAATAKKGPPTTQSFPGMISFSIGPAETIFMLHEHSLRLESGYFKKYTLEDDDKATPMKFPEIKPKIFQLFTTWMFMNTFKEGEKMEECSLEFSDLVKIYMIAEKYEIVVLKNVVVDCLVRLFKKYSGWVPMAPVEEIYGGTVPVSALRKLWVEFYIRGEVVEQGVQLYNPAFLSDVVERQKDMIHGINPKVSVGTTIDPEFFYDTEPKTGRRHGRASFF